MITQVKRQKDITSRQSGNHDVFAAGRFSNSKFDKGRSSGKENEQKPEYKPEGKGDGKANFKRDFKKAKMDRTCTYCKEKGHLKETCFKLVRIPDWYKELKAGGGKTAPGAPNGKFVANIGDIQQFGGAQFSHPLTGDAESHTNGQVRPIPDEHMINALIAAAVKKVRGKEVADQSPPTDGMNFAGPFN